MQIDELLDFLSCLVEHKVSYMTFISETAVTLNGLLWE